MLRLYVRVRKSHLPEEYSQNWLNVVRVMLKARVIKGPFAIVLGR